ncbi:MAG: sigma-54-dependent Fis family transcriptional regulator [Zymomonas mobilis subsp. pomaceae]|uniref:Transcriptional regulator, NifA subfamily, Fis Family n=1 Tax=Zymomonas mobilis subsp. pomaceae (strain ATCC 29192 / DSM 22645 / JCM 10191 / CCUG 17912 / NBRC 13757 / NCIMB 11200 / NRRL B-4491 / Barker I) TaxID=579138 RepID=F8ESW1_ZYMMT|nr:sigma-54-dependent Fis family transcriptional regulator [Zymomonas mobilis]AEI37865.1 transcriptional regulator, NifA subfamily, Fis Family [Zymomonas mobilis subsp. pomaceae ATCC 29192]MDX5949232.1 sigma-54-dependent Fis family transcriptional regulator [Zymomonas mobilis subsp. pomaceae]GEB89539.1 sigma-54-dependent Fis family transcriptional regulator [Zymomonas mobilis subsp. pomaceae]
MNDTVTLEINVIDSFEEFSHCFTGECRVAILPILYEISQVLTDSADLTASIPVILNTMQNHLKMQRGIITLYDRHVDTIFIHDSFGLTEEEKTRGIYALGEGVTGKVVEKGKAIVAKRLIDNSDFLNRTGSSYKKRHTKTAFFSVPIMRGQKVLGTIGAERVYMNPQLLRQDVQLLAMIASMLAPAAELYLVENIEKVRLENENSRLKNTLKKRFKPSNIIGSSKPMQDIYQLIHKVAATKATVLILGESGVGKELVATAIHYNSPSADGPFIKANCAAFPESLAESELFGHEKGAFTGAVATHKGFFEQADGGTIFLDEVGELSLSVQTKLLRVLQERTFQRVGGSKPINIDVRIIAATNRNLAEMVEEGTFREDLYYRLNVFPMMIPPLRDRGSDVITLADYFVKFFAQENNKDIKRISTPALNMLMSYKWPGNVRELENVIERAVILADDDAIHSYDLPPSLQTEKETKAADTPSGITLESRIQAIETKMIVEALKNNNGHMGEAAKELGLTRRMLSVRMERYGISYKSFRTHNNDTHKKENIG